MKPFLLSAVTGALALLAVAPLAAQDQPMVVDVPPPPAAKEWQESDFLTNIRRITVEGKRAGEGYFSADGKRMVFQSEREPGNPFYQIYEMDLELGDVRRVSPGMGNTTCSFINPVTGDILFASTHGYEAEAKKYADDEVALRESGKERRYSWSYEPEMEIFVEKAATKELVRLTNARGYDAEGAWSPDGKTIVFSSLRDGYDRALSDEEQKLLEINPSYFGELYLMDADGANVRRLTHEPGYDGGPFFSRDGSKIIWRRFDKHGLTADVYTMNADGTGERRITDFGALSWAPYFTHDDSMIVFASNKLGFANFEVFAVDALGEKEPVRITYTDGFDGLPVPTPNGKQLFWTSTRGKLTGGQIFAADLNIENMRQALAQAPPRKAAEAKDDKH